MTPSTPEIGTCFGCGHTHECEVIDAWMEPGGGMNFQVSTCCEWAHDNFLEEYNDVAQLARGREGKQYRRAFADWWTLQTGQQDCRLDGNPWDGVRVIAPLELVRCGPLADGDPRALKRDDVKEFIRQHHRHNAPPVGWRWGYAVFNGAELVAVAMVGRPVARRIDHHTVVEVNRVCVDPGFDSNVVAGACSMIYGAAARDARGQGFGKIITYTLEAEAGAGCRGAGWSPAARTAGGSWDRPSRPRVDRAPTCRKTRWEFDL